MVQAAHRGEAESINVVQYPCQTLLTVNGRWSWSIENLMAVLEGEVTTQSDLYSFAAAVRALTGNPTVREFRVKAPDGSSCRWRDENFVLQPAALEDFTSKGSVIVELTYHGRIKNSNPYIESRPVAPEETAAVHRLVSTDCLVSSVPIELDGKRLTGLINSESRVPIAAFPLDTLNAPAILLPSDLWDSKHSGAVLLTASFQQSNKKLTVKPPESAIWWIQDGVIVRRDKIFTDGPLELTVLASAAGLKTDISGLVLVKDEQMKTRAQQIKKAATSVLTEIRAGFATAPFESLLQSVKLKRESRWFFWRPRDIVLTSDDVRQINLEIQKQIQELPRTFAGKSARD